MDIDVDGDCDDAQSLNNYDSHETNGQNQSEQSNSSTLDNQNPSEQIEDDSSFPIDQYLYVKSSLGVDEAVSQAALANLRDTFAQTTIEGDKIAWIGCAFYLASIKEHYKHRNTANQSRSSCLIPAAKILDICNISTVDLFERLHTWVQVGAAASSLTDRVKEIHSSFSICFLIFKQFLPMFRWTFQINQQQNIKTQHAELMQQANELFELSWLFYVLCKKRLDGVGTDLLSSYHLLLCTVDFIYQAVINSSQYVPLTNPNIAVDYVTGSILDVLCSEFDGVALDVKHFRAHFWTTQLTKLLGSTEHCRTFGALPLQLENPPAFLNSVPHTIAQLNELYSHVLTEQPALDERMFLMKSERELNLADNNFLELVSANLQQKPRYSPNSDEDTDMKLDTDALVRLHVQTIVHKVNQAGAGAPGTPLTGKSYVISDEQLCPATGISRATQLCAHLNMLTTNDSSELRTASLSAEIAQVLTQDTQTDADIGKIVHRHVQAAAQLINNQLLMESSREEYADDVSMNGFVPERCKQIQFLFYRLFERIVQYEKDRIQGNKDSLKPFLMSISYHKPLAMIIVYLQRAAMDEQFHRCLVGACTELVLFCHSSKREFPWSITSLSLPATQFYKVIEMIIRSEPDLSREMVKHLNMVEERVLEEYAWTADSPVWDKINLDEAQPLPTCQQVMDLSELGSVPANNRSMSSMLIGQSPSQPQQAAKRKLLFEHDAEQDQATNNIKINNTINQARPIGGTIRLPSRPALVGPHRTLPPPPTIFGEEQNVVKTSDEPSPNKCNKPQSLTLFIRKVYYLCSVRLIDLCSRARLDERTRQIAWTLLEQVIATQTHLLKDRHMDQHILSALYMTCKASVLPTGFQDLLCSYRQQPQSRPSVYRQVLIETDTDKEYADIIEYYNQCFVPCMANTANNLVSPKQTDRTPLSPLPKLRSSTPLKMKRCVSNGIYVKPMDERNRALTKSDQSKADVHQAKMATESQTNTLTLPSANNRPALRYTIGQSPQKYLSSMNASQQGQSRAQTQTQSNERQVLLVRREASDSFQVVQPHMVGTQVISNKNVLHS